MHGLSEVVYLAWRPIAESTSEGFVDFINRHHDPVNRFANACLALVVCVVRACRKSCFHCSTPFLGATGFLVFRWFRRLLRLASSASFCVIFRAGIVFTGLLSRPARLLRGLVASWHTQFQLNKSAYPLS